MNFENGFKDLIVWKKAKELCLLVNKMFINCKNYTFRDQIHRSSLSVMNNIAEGFDRYNRKDMRNFLRIAKGSLGETESMIELALSLKYITINQHEEFNLINVEIRKLIVSYIMSVNKKINS